MLVAAQLAGFPTQTIHRLISAFTDAIHADPKTRNDNNEIKITKHFLEQCCANGGVGSAETAQLLEMAQTEACKKQLQRNTQQAIEVGAFGSPSILVENAPQFGTFLIFGSDRFEQLTCTGLPWLGPNPAKARL